MQSDSQKPRSRSALARHEAGEHENIFIAKNRDSESAHRVVNYISRVAQTSQRFARFKFESKK
jgi:hypothetical protein